MSELRRLQVQRPDFQICVLDLGDIEWRDTLALEFWTK